MDAARSHDGRESHLFCTGSDVVLTMVDGTILYENGEYPTIDIEKEIAETCAARERILSEMA